MRKIGYIHHYSQEHKRGVLVYGYDKGYNNGAQIVEFDNSKLVNEQDIETGILVYFSLNKNKEVTAIEKASIYNFDRKLIRALLSLNESKQKYQDNEFTNIRYKENIQCDNDDKEKLGQITKNEISINAEDDLDSFINEYFENLFPEEPKYIIIDILKPSYWIPKKIASKSKFYGKTIEEFVDLFTLFGRKIAVEWKPLLSQLPYDELTTLLNDIPALQPLCPKQFCENYLHSLYLTDNFPSKKICFNFYVWKISQVNSIETYYDIDESLSHKKASNCIGISISKLSKNDQFKLKQLLEHKFNDCIIPLIKTLWRESSSNNPERIIDIINSKDSQYLKGLAYFLEIISDDNFTFSDNDQGYICQEVYNYYNHLNKNDRESLRPYYSLKINKAFTDFSTCEYFSTKGLTTKLLLSNYINIIEKDTIEQFIKNSSSQWIDISTFDELKYVFDCKVIDDRLLFQILCRLTINLNTYQLAKFITESSAETGFLNFYELPINIQEYLLLRLVDKYVNVEKNSNYIKISDYNGFYGLDSFIRWLTELKSGQYGKINIGAIDVAISKIIENLDKEYINYLYEKKFLVHKGENISTRLSQYCENLCNSIEYQRYRDSLYDEDSSDLFRSTYAQDEMGYSDDDIDTIFDGDPDAYWNVD